MAAIRVRRGAGGCFLSRLRPMACSESAQTARRRASARRPPMIKLRRRHIAGPWRSRLRVGGDRLGAVSAGPEPNHSGTPGPAVTRKAHPSHDSGRGSQPVPAAAAVVGPAAPGEGGRSPDRRACDSDRRFPPPHRGDGHGVRLGRRRAGRRRAQWQRSVGCWDGAGGEAVPELAARRCPSWRRGGARAVPPRARGRRRGPRRAIASKRRQSTRKRGSRGPAERPGRRWRVDAASGAGRRPSQPRRLERVGRAAAGFGLRLGPGGWVAAGGQRLRVSRPPRRRRLRVRSRRFGEPVKKA